MFLTSLHEFTYTNGTTWPQRFTVDLPPGGLAFTGTEQVRVHVKRQGQFRATPLTALESGGAPSPHGSVVSIVSISALQLVVDVEFSDEETEAWPMEEAVVFDVKIVLPSGREGTPFRVTMTPIGGYANG